MPGKSIYAYRAFGGHSDHRHLGRHAVARTGIRQAESDDGRVHV